LLVSSIEACTNCPISCGGSLSFLPVTISLADKNSLTPPFLVRELIRMKVLYIISVRNRLGSLLNRIPVPLLGSLFLKGHISLKN
jgi:hypothetical protein